MQTRIGDDNTTVITKEDLQSAANNNTIKGVLTRVYKFFMVAFGKNRTPVWNKLMDSYINDPVNNVPNTRNKQTSAKGNMKREYLGAQLSWPKFCEAMRFAKFTKLEIIFIVEDEDGQRMKMSEELNFVDMADEEFDNELLGSKVQEAMGEHIYKKLNEEDARFAVQKSAPVRRFSRGKDWISSPVSEIKNTDIQEIINNNTVA